MDSQNRICWVCFPQRDGAEPMGGELVSARRRLFADPKHTVSIDKTQNVKGFSGHLRGKLGKRHFYWKKKLTGTSGGEVIVEEAFGQKDGWVVVTRDMYGVIVSRNFFNKQHDWLRAEYYEPWDAGRARVRFTEEGDDGTILRRDWDPETKIYHDTLLYRVPYRSGTAEQSIIDAQFGEPQLLLALLDGEACCCPKEEADARAAAMKNVSSGTVVLMPAWEIKGGELVREDGAKDDDANITFTSLEEYAKIEPPEPGKPQPALTGEILPAPAPGSHVAEALRADRPAPAHFAPEKPLPPMAEEFAPERVDPVEELPLIEPHEARHMKGPVNYEELIDAPVEPTVQRPPVQQPVQQPVVQPPAPVQPMAQPMPQPPVMQQPAAPQHMVPQPLIEPPPRQPIAPPVVEMPKPQPAAPAQPPAQPMYAQPAPPPPPAHMAPDPQPPRHEAPVVQEPAVREPAAQEPAAQEAPPEEGVDLDSILAEAALYGSAPNLPEQSQETAGGMAIPNGYTGDIKNGRITGRGRTEQHGGMTSYEGDYVNGKREGFGTYYYKDGNLCYAGAWKDDRREGLGVSFRDSDHALHVANWRDGAPQGLVTLFDSAGNLRFSGRMENGKKEGAGVVINGEDGTVFVGQWAGGEATGLGSAFDRDGRLLYYGSWKDGKRHGHGTEFDLNGGVVFDGEFRDGKYFNGVLYQKL